MLKNTINYRNMTIMDYYQPVLNRNIWKFSLKDFQTNSNNQSIPKKETPCNFYPAAR
jgi:hypothetical protein